MKNKKILAFLIGFIFYSVMGFSQIKISTMPTFNGDPTGSFIPIIVNGVNRKIDAGILKSAPPVSVAQLRTLSSPSTTSRYYTTDKGEEGFWYYDSTDVTSADNTGTILVDGTKRFKRIFDGAVNVNWFGAIADGVTDNTAAIRSAIAYANNMVGSSVVPTLWFPNGNSYIITDSIYIPAGINVKMDAPIFFQGTAYDRSALTIGKTGVVSSNIKYQLNVASKTQSNWSNENNVGIRLFNCNTCDINIVQASNFTVGVEFKGDNAGFAYSTATIGSLWNNKIAEKIFATNNGWVNENSFYGGRLTCASSTNLGKARYGVVITSDMGYYSNNNNWYKPSFELYGQGATPNECVPIDIKFGTLTAFKDCRQEGNGDGGRNIFVRTLNASSYNNISLGYGQGILLDSSSIPTSLITNRTFQLTQTVAASQEYNSGDLITRLNPYDNNNWYILDELFFVTSSGTIIQTTDTTATKKYPTYLFLSQSRAMGVRLATDVGKRYILKRSVINGNGGYVAFQCFDNSGNVLYSPSIKYIKGTDNYNINPNSSFGGCYSTGTNSYNDLYFQVDTAVKYVDVILFGGDANGLSIKSFKIQCLDGTTVVRNLKTKSGKYATQAPTFGTWEQGTVIKNINPISNTISWVCTVAGTPGTWVATSINPTFSSILSKPTTLSGYGITDAYPLTGNPSGFLNAVPWSIISSKPINISGYGIGDAMNDSTINSSVFDANTVSPGFKSWFSGVITNGASGASFGGVISFSGSNNNNLQFQYDNGNSSGIGDLYFRTKNIGGFLPWHKIATTNILSLVATTGSYSDLTNKPFTSGTAAPTTTPASINLFFLDTTNKKLYVSTGTVSSADWTILN